MATIDPSERRFLRLRRLTDAARAFTYATRREEVARLAVHQAAALLDAPRALLALEDHEGNLRLEAAHGVPDAEPGRLYDSGGDLAFQTLLAAPPDGSGDRFLGVPLVVRGRVIGMLAVLAPALAQPFGKEEEWALSALADHAAAALELERLDLDVRIRLEEQLHGLEQMQEQRQRALATLAHDLRAPLNAIVAFTEALHSQVLGPLEERQRDAVHRIRVSATHLVAVTSDLLDAALLRAGATMVALAPVRCDTVMEEAALIVRPEALARGQSLEVEPAGAPVVAADANRLRQVLVNLLENAVKYTAPGGRIHLRAGTREVGGDGWAIIAVEDTGPGIPAEELEAIFEAYHRATDDRRAPGAGLGLSISRGLVRQMDGDIEVSSTPGVGSTFVVRLRLAEPAGDPPAPLHLEPKPSAELAPES